MSVQVLIGLGNPGEEFYNTRHNVGQSFLEYLVDEVGESFSSQKNFQGKVASIQLNDRSFRLLIPTTYMNLSGRSVSAFLNFYKIDLKNALVIHDEVAFDVGVARFKAEGGVNGHNGLKSISSSSSNRYDFPRIRIGVGRPDHSSQMSSYLTQQRIRAEEAEAYQSLYHFLKLNLDLLTQDRDRFIEKLHASNF